MTDASGDRHYRRGVVLGLTLAETFLLLLFVLLLVLSLGLIREIEQHDEAQKQQAELEKRFEEKVASLTEQLDSLAGSSNPEREYSDTFSELLFQRDRLQKEADAVQEKTDELQERNDQAEKQLQEKTDQLKDYQAIERALEGTGAEDYSPGQIAKALEGTEETLALKDAIEGAGFPTDPDRLAKALQEKGQELDAAVEGQEASKQRLDYFKRTHGLSNELPSCWIHPETKQAEYIFDAALRSDGLMLHERIIPHREAEKKQLPMTNIRYQLMMDRKTFETAVLSLWKWSEANECRFHVRVFDYTGPREKLRYKESLKTVENFFYKYSVQDNTTTRPGQVGH